jgi:hypothetical protein
MDSATAPPRAPSHSVTLEHLLDSTAPKHLLIVIAGEARRTTSWRTHLPERARARMVMSITHGGATTTVQHYSNGLYVTVAMCNMPVAANASLLCYTIATSMLTSADPLLL